jgi:Rps23 Pro-64 3,4-dihydroxylase Tpa1-like proline 4-hydroxylase
MGSTATDDATGGRPDVDFGPALEVDALARVYAQAGRIHIPGILAAECAKAAHQSMRDEVPWQLHFNDAGSVYDLAPEQIRAWPPAKQKLLHQRLNANAVASFQFLFDNFPLSDAHDNPQHHSLYLMRVFEFLNSARFLDFARRLTGEPRIALADAQATLYRPGHFLTEHDDSIAGPRRLAAYVLNLTPRWRADWGGLLLFLDRDGHVAQGYTPVFNALNVFKVPQRHAVSCVAPFAGSGRYSISGWFRES